MTPHDRDLRNRARALFVQGEVHGLPEVAAELHLPLPRVRAWATAGEWAAERERYLADEREAARAKMLASGAGDRAKIFRGLGLALGKVTALFVAKMDVISRLRESAKADDRALAKVLGRVSSRDVAAVTAAYRAMWEAGLGIEESAKEIHTLAECEEALRRIRGKTGTPGIDP